MDVQLGTGVRGPAKPLPDYIRDTVRRVTEAREGARMATAKAQAQNERQAGRDIAGDRRLCSGCAYHGCGDSEPRRPSDPVAETIATHPRRWSFRDTGPGR
ncbi:unnamed protein product [Lampetra fluviatilis]